MDQDHFDHMARGLAAGRSRRGLLGAGAALVALLAATPVAAGKAGKANAPRKPPKNPGNNQPGTGQNGQPGSGQLGSSGPSPTCEELCEEQFDDCTREGLDPDYCEDYHLSCIAQCRNG